MPGALIGATLRDHRMPRFEDGVVVGAGAKILGDITIGKCAVIAANSVVTDSIPPYALVAGNPGRIITRTSHQMSWQSKVSLMMSNLA